MDKLLAVTANVCAAALLSFARCSYADPVLPSDVQVSLSAEKTRDLRPGDMVNFTMSVKNNGPSMLGYFAITGPHVFTQFYKPGMNWNDDCAILMDTGDSVYGPFWVLVWLPAGLAQEDPVASGETRVCHFTLVVAPGFPSEYDFKVELNNYFTDLNAANNAAAVLLQRDVLMVPIASWLVLTLLASLILAFSLRWLAASAGPNYSFNRTPLCRSGDSERYRGGAG